MSTTGLSLEYQPLYNDVLANGGLSQIQAVYEEYITSVLPLELSSHFHSLGIFLGTHCLHVLQFASRFHGTKSIPFKSCAPLINQLLQSFLFLSVSLSGLITRSDSLLSPPKS